MGRKTFFLLMILLAGCGAKPGRDCDQPTTQIASIVNRTGRDLDLEVSFKDLGHGGARMLARVQLLAGQKIDQVLSRAYFVKRFGYVSGDGKQSIDATCSAEADQKFVHIGLTDKSFREATNCRNFYQQITTLEPYNANCDRFSKAQTNPE